VELRIAGHVIGFAGGDAGGFFAWNSPSSVVAEAAGEMAARSIPGKFVNLMSRNPFARDAAKYHEKLEDLSPRGFGGDDGRAFGAERRDYRFAWIRNGGESVGGAG